MKSKVVTTLLFMTSASTISGCEMLYDIAPPEVIAERERREAEEEEEKFKRLLPGNTEAGSGEGESH